RVWRRLLENSLSAKVSCWLIRLLILGSGYNTMISHLGLIRTFLSAQCSPRPACPLKGALLMQVHDRPQGAPVLALAGDSVSVKRMQNHAP
ncbi:hypothetical protein V5029_07030, partial [Enterobacter hormaechei]